MSTEELPELRENSIKRLSRSTWASLTHGNRATWATIGIVALVVIAVAAYYYIRNQNLKADSELWREIDSVGTPEALEKVAKDHPKTTAGKIARIDLARRALHPEGIVLLPSREKEKRRKAIESIQSAREKYKALTDEVRDIPELRAECMLQHALAEEVLVGVPDTDAKIETAISLYQKLVDDKQLKDSFQARIAERHLKSLSNPDEATRFYTEINKAVEEYIASGKPVDGFHSPPGMKPTPPFGPSPFGPSPFSPTPFPPLPPTPSGENPIAPILKPEPSKPEPTKPTP